MKPNREYRYFPVEVRQNDDGNTAVTGTVVRYGDIAELPWFSEEFRAGWVANSSDVMWANRMHNRDEPLAVSDGELKITDGKDRMAFDLVLPETTHGNNARIEIEERLIRGASLEFVVTKDEYDYERGHRVVVSGRMFGFGLVDKPAYPDSVATMKRAQEYRAHYGLVVPEPEAKPVTTQKSPRLNVMV